MKRIKRRMAGIILIVMLLTILLSPGSFSAWADKTDDAVDDEFDISAIIDNDDGVIIAAPGLDDVDTDDSDENINDEESPYQVGDIITFGKYEQDGDFENGKEDIEWRVLKVDAGRVLVVSKYALDCQPYNINFENVTWETCSLRAWLNNDFLNEAFSEEEQAQIPCVTISNEDNGYYETTGGSDTTDQIFCLSANEVKDFIGYSKYDDIYQYGISSSLIVEPTQYAIDRGASAFAINESDYDTYFKDNGFSTDVIGNSGAWWWLRSPGYGNKCACVVDRCGIAGTYYFNYVNTGNRVVRPALFIDTSIVAAGIAEELEDPITIPEEDIEDIPASEDEINDMDSEDQVEDEDIIDDEEPSIIDENTDIKPEDGDSNDNSEEENTDEENSEDAKPDDVNPEDVKPEERSSEEEIVEESVVENGEL